MKISVILFSVGAPEIILIVLVVLLIFGGKKIPELMRGLGKGLSEFKKGVKDPESKEKSERKDDHKEDGK